ncbi:uncharacterized protein [Medicago truncatula]|uniref:uncharacterized protein isoform X2 n=1 Tax=Medicago truncatula TaxID=3880 RepID=UPI001966EFC5|nr:uncharacterized protein LOC25500665 isoform X2 [Medicago truncatula]
MEACEEENGKKIPKLPLFMSPPPMHYSPERSGTKTPPLHITASIPFGWEEEPGKPRPCTDLVTFSNPTLVKCLELPPRLFIDTKVPSPTTVLDGPYKKECCDSFGYESGKLGSLILKEEIRVKKKGCFGSDKNVKMRKKIKHYGSFDNPFHVKSLVWTKMCEGWKRVVPWKSEKVNKYQCWWF